MLSLCCAVDCFLCCSMFVRFQCFKLPGIAVLHACQFNALLVDAACIRLFVLAAALCLFCHLEFDHFFLMVVCSLAMLLYIMLSIFFSPVTVYVCSVHRAPSMSSVLLGVFS